MAYIIMYIQTHVTFEHEYSKTMDTLIHMSIPLGKAVKRLGLAQNMTYLFFLGNVLVSIGQSNIYQISTRPFIGTSGKKSYL